MNTPTGTTNERPSELVDGLIRDYVKEIDGVPHVVLEQYTNGEWVQVAAVEQSKIDEQNV